MKNGSRFTLFEMVLTAIFIALTVLSARINVAIGPIPMTFQSMVVILAGILLGPKRGWMVPMLYLVMGLAGLPFFSTGGGLGYLFKPTFGFLIGFIPAAWSAGAVYQMSVIKSDQVRCFVGALSALIFMYGVGLLYIPFGAMVYGNDLAAWSAIVSTLPLMIVGDLIKSFALTLVVPVLMRELKATQAMFQS